MNHINLRVNKFSTFILLTYAFFISISLIIGILGYLNGSMETLKIMMAGVLLPIFFSGWNCIAINYMGNKKPQLMFEFNIMRFLVNFVFVILLMYVGVYKLSMDLVVFGLTLFFTWFTLHMIEAFYSATFLKRIKDIK